jgi:hypothetical protein
MHYESTAKNFVILGQGIPPVLSPNGVSPGRIIPEQGQEYWMVSKAEYRDTVSQEYHVRLELGIGCILSYAGIPFSRTEFPLVLNPNFCFCCCKE